jgi:hypothetical protein
MSSDSSLPPLPQPSRGSRIVPALFGLLLVVLMVVFFVRQTRWTHSLVNPVESYAKYLNHEGLKTDQPHAPNHKLESTVGTPYELIVDDKPVWIIDFDKSNEAAIKQQSAIRASKMVEVDGKPMQATVEKDGSLVLVGYEDHPDKAKLLEALDNFDKQ